MRICVLIPTYNEAKTIASLVRQIRSQHLDTLVIDDGSTDNTYQIARDSGAIVFKNERNQGKGLSLIKGFDYILKNNFDAVITMDGDGQHLPDEIPKFINCALSSDSGIIIGNRMLTRRNMPFVRVLTNKVMSWFISKVSKQKMPDTQCGFRLIKKEVLKKLHLNTSKYETESEILIKASKLGFKIESLPIESVYVGEKSHIHPIIDTLRFFRFIFKKL